MDNAFFQQFDLAHLQGQYANDGPDVMFDETRFPDRAGWARIEPYVAETREPATSASVTVTAMDYGAVGQLRAFAKTGCGGWQPATIVFGRERRSALDIPIDEDANLMADSLDAYLGESGRDDDNEPVGNGMKGDGLTAFEEYRGFLTSGGDCADPKVDQHVRTALDRKDLFVHAPNPQHEAALPHFAWSSSLPRDVRWMRYHPIGTFCTINAGTELNALPGDDNHAGDSQVACGPNIVINDTWLRGVR